VKQSVRFVVVGPGRIYKGDYVIVTLLSHYVTLYMTMRHSNSALSTSALFPHYQQKTKFSSIELKSIHPHTRMNSTF
jgi:hypothetical protein